MTARTAAGLASSVIIALLATLTVVGDAQEKVNPTGAQVKGFLDRVAAYVEARAKLEKGLTSVNPGTPGRDTEQQEAALAARVRAARATARQGDLFGDATPLFQEILARDRRSRGPRDTGAAFEEVPAASRVRVNGTYPAGAALATVPPLILSNLPPLPDSLEYRFLGRDLILRDRASNLIVDFIPGALPAPK